MQLAEEHHFNEVQPGNAKNNASGHKDRLKWPYILYILDGQQSMTSHRQALLFSSDDAVQSNRKLLIPKRKAAALEVPAEQTLRDMVNLHKTNFTDLHLI